METKTLVQVFCFLMATIIVASKAESRFRAQHIIQDGPMCYGAENAIELPTAPLPPEAPPLPTLWSRGKPEDVEAVTDWMWTYAKDPWLVAAVINVESGGRVTAVSHVGARGLMQIMPPTAKGMARVLDIDYTDGVEFEPLWNVRVGTAYLEYLLDRYKGDETKALTAYNRGPGNTDAILRNYGKIPAHVRASYSDLVLARVLGR